MFGRLSFLFGLFFFLPLAWPPILKKNASYISKIPGLKPHFSQSETLNTRGQQVKVSLKYTVHMRRMVTLLLLRRGVAAKKAKVLTKAGKMKRWTRIFYMPVGMSPFI